MARALICDRCGAVYKQEETYNLKYQLRIEEDVSFYKAIDICPKCHSDLEKWFEGVGHISMLYEDDMK